MRRALTLAASVLACRPAATEPPPPAAVTSRPAPAPDPCAEAPVPAELAEALARADALLRCDDERGALDVALELLRRAPTSTARAYALAELAHDLGPIVDLAAAAAALPLSPRARAVFELTRGVLADLDAPDPARGAALARDIAATLALVGDDFYALALALRFTAARDDDPRERAAPLCRERAERRIPRAGDKRGAAVLAATCAEIAFLAGEPTVGRSRFLQALTLDPGLHSAGLAWAAAELAAGNDAAAARLYAGATASPRRAQRYAAHLGLGVARARMHERGAAERAYREAARERGVGERPARSDRLPPELLFNLGALLADAEDSERRAEARELLRAYSAHPAADARRRLRARVLLRELGE